MENRARRMFVLLTIVYAFALHSTLADDTKATTTSPPVTASPSGSSAPTDSTSSAQKEHNVNTEPQVSATTTTTSINNNSLTKFINIEVYYEALCNDSVNFVSDKLLPVYNKLNKFINVTFIPFAQGNITVNPDKTVKSLICKREHECEADKVHACAINKIKDNEKLVKFVNCSLTEGFVSSNKIVPIETCGKNNSLDESIITEIKNCSNSLDAWVQWFQNYSTLSSNAHVTTVPKILINQKEINDDILTSNNFMKAVCELLKGKDLPDDCKTLVSGSDKLVVGILPIIIGAFYIIKMI
ncbi:GILT-like protein 1 [Melanaphis sacchari]|uniref:Gamma-interferon-inducible lysosomal thiol reductase n=1 Tax=Melanaphis sacchari TaxID=742174 RepID=A0A2H8TUP3_9HEMI|nr:GILT-like protein 1 [Melanaphis sacchari]